MTRVKNWYVSEAEAMAAWKDRGERLGHYIAVVKRSSNNKQVGYYVGKPEDIQDMDRRFTAKIILKVKSRKKKNTKNRVFKGKPRWA